jgi:hypothetical protein
MADRITYLARRQPRADPVRREIATTLRDLHGCIGAGGADRLLDQFLQRCLDLVSGTAAGQPGIDVLCELARAALSGERDDRAVLAYAETLPAAPGPLSYARRIPGRVVWLAAMAKSPEGDEAGTAAALLVNDLAALGSDLPLRTLQAALRSLPKP